MPSRTLPSFTRAEVEAHNTSRSCYVTIGNYVYDVTDFVDDHPGGADLILEYAGKDVEEILKDVASHPHSEAAYEVLEESVVGFLISEKLPNGVAGPPPVPVDGSKAATTTAIETEWNSDDEGAHPRTGMSCAEDLSKETDIEKDYQKHKFLDLNKPLFKQVWLGGFSKDFYLDQVHRPRHYKGGKSAPLFGNFLEPLTKTPWWVIPALWWPCITYGTYLASQGISHVELVAWWIFGLLTWTLVEYILHRFLFHLDYWLPDNRVGITLHFTLHGIHHYLPMDRYRLVMPPTLFLALAIPFWKLVHVIFAQNWYYGTAAFSGGIFGYSLYDMTHYFLHHQNLPLWYKSLKKYHLQHHFLDYENGFGVTSRFWDRVFGTELPLLVKAK
jgi:4-hydroxysphinganine ceramide fatty acyl 2-hydroxylase